MNLPPTCRLHTLPCPALQYPEADILTSSDHLVNTNGADEGLEIWPHAASAANIGIMLFRPKGHELAAVGAAGCCWVQVLGAGCWTQLLPGPERLQMTPAPALSSCVLPSCCRRLQEWVNVLEKDSNVWDQNAFNDLFRRGSKPLPDRKDHLFE